MFYRTEAKEERHGAEVNLVVMFSRESIVEGIWNVMQQRTREETRKRSFAIEELLRKRKNSSRKVSHFFRFYQNSKRERNVNEKDTI